MKTYSADWIAALEAGDGVSHGAVKISTASPFLVWGGHGDLTLDSEVYKGIGNVGLVTVTGSQLGGMEQGIDLILSGVDPDIIPLIEAADVRRAPAKVWRLGFDSTGTELLDARVFARGRVDRLVREDVPGGTATIRCTVETAARGLGRSTGRMCSDADQRMIDPDDNGMKRVSHAAELSLAWGGKPPARAASALPGASPLNGLVIGPFHF